MQSNQPYIILPKANSGKMRQARPRRILVVILLAGLGIFQKTAAQPAGLLLQDRTAQIRFVISRLEAQQVKSDPVFLKGSYPSFIYHRKHFKKKKKDITIFYNILIDMTLKQLRPRLPDRLQVRVDTLRCRSAALYPRFYNRQRGSYNFWLRDSAYTFPYSWWIPLIKKDGAVPDDMDDTVLSRFTAPQGNRDSLEKLHRRMQDYVLKPGEKLRTALPAYRDYLTYSTWFGRKFPVVLDAVVLSNILSFVNHYDLPWSGADSAALQLIVHTIISGDYADRPLAISPYYGQTAILLYHYSRLMEQKPIPMLDSLRPDLIRTCHNILSRKHISLMEKVITANALIQLGEPAPPLALPAADEWEKQVEQSNFAYFIGNIPSYMPRTAQQLFTRVGALMYYHFCPAFNDALVLQYLVSSPGQATLNQGALAAGTARE